MQARPLTKEEIPLIVSCFFLATPESLKGMGTNPDKLPSKLEWTQTIEKKIDLPLE